MMDLIVKFRYLAVLLLAAGLAPVSSTAAAQQARVAAERVAGVEAALMSPAELGRGIVHEAARRDRGWRDERVSGRILVRDGAGVTSTRVLRRERRRDEHGGLRSLLLVESEDGAVGVALLTHAPQDAAARRWVRAPGSDVIDPVATAHPGGPLGDSVLVYEDLAPAGVDRYAYRWLRDEAVDGLDLAAIERVPLDVPAAYARQVLWIDLQEYRTWRVDSYGHDGALVKTLRLLRYRRHRDAHWRAQVVHVIDHRTGASTTLQWSDPEFDVGLSDDDFAVARLQRLR